MKIFRDKTDYDGTVVALGNFDGLHIAHMTIIRNGIKYAKENGLKSGVLLFEENTNDVVGHKIELITPNEASWSFWNVKSLILCIWRNLIRSL